MLRTLRLTLTPLLALGLLGACDGDDGGTCEPMETQSCLGPGGCDGTQTCGADGTLGACVCEGDDAGPPVEMDAGPEGTDAGPGDSDAGEGTDGGPGADGGPMTDAGPPAPTGQRIFVTSGTYTGRIERSGTAAGLASADAICDLLATAASLGGTWKAWLSTDSENALDRVMGPGPYVNMNGATVFPNRASLEVGMPMAPLALDENGSVVQDDVAMPGAAVWTGSTNTGSAIMNAHCVNWTSAAGGLFGDEGQIGIADAAMPMDSREWSSSRTYDCNQTAHLYCFEQP